MPHFKIEQRQHLGVQRRVKSVQESSMFVRYRSFDNKVSIDRKGREVFCVQLETVAIADRQILAQMPGKTGEVS